MTALHQRDRLTGGETMNAPLRFKENRNMIDQCAVLEDSVNALRAALERERQLRRDLEVVVGNFLHENAMLREIIRFQESLEAF